ncbi:MAG: helix-turn-helix domain-containing protein [Defluviitaleaceae bacterium]|nr:helix-turn-helix domain-containing protein [Defluviitaleaceae bacterium]
MDIEQIICESTLYIRAQYNEPITVADIAADVCLSPSYFSFMFRTFTGYTVKNYLNRYRLYCAASDLRDSSKPLVEIAYAHGFSSQQAFTRSFSQMYGTSPAQFRLQKLSVSPFPPENLWLAGRTASMELMQCFENVRFMHKDAFYVVGVEVDIHYNSDDGTSPIGGLWEVWSKEKIAEQISDQLLDGVVYGITHSETADNKAKYFIGVEVKNLDNLPVGLVGRKFHASEIAVFNTTLAIILTGDFWRTFYSKWLPSSGYKTHDEPHRTSAFDKYPTIEVYGRDFDGEQSVMQIYAPVARI